MHYLLALSAAGILGVADFFGGIAARRGSVLPVIIVSRGTGVLVMAGVLAIFPAVPSGADLAWGAAAGLAGGTGLALLYRGLASGDMAMVAPVTAVTSAVVPFTFGLLVGERLSQAAVTGVLLALLGVALLSYEGPARSEWRVHAPRRPAPPDRALGLALLSGAAIGAFFILLSRTSPQASVWPLVASRSAALLLFLGLATARRAPLWPRGDASLPAFVAALLDAAGTALYLFSVHLGPLALVAVLTSLYPASTVLLARAVLGERLSRARVAGLLCAFVAIAIILMG